MINNGKISNGFDFIDSLYIAQEKIAADNLQLVPNPFWNNILKAGFGVALICSDNQITKLRGTGTLISAIAGVLNS